MKKNLIILRGIPGSGKSTVAQLFNSKAICTADDYFTYNNVYNWKADKIGAAHTWCQKKCKRFMQVSAQTIVIANTNTVEKEFQPYIDLAKKYGYKVFSLIVENRHDGKNDHNVPEESIAKMRNRFQIKL